MRAEVRYLYIINKMRIDVITLFPEMFKGPLTESILDRAQKMELLELNFHDLREFGTGNYKQVDDSPYGGGAGMVLRADVIVEAIEAVEDKVKSEKLIVNSDPYRIYLSPRGERLVQGIAKDHEWLILVCGRYEGIDQRVIDGGWIDEEISIGDYVLTGGELPAAVLIDAVARQIPGVLGKDESAEEESFSESLDRKREYPHYTRPEEFRGHKVPDVLLGGNHGEIDKWRKENTK